MQHITEKMKKAKFLLGLSLMMALTPLVHAGKTGGGGTTGGTTPPPTAAAFSFQYTVGTVLNFHAYGFAAQVGAIAQPSGTLRLGNWYVWDLGAVTGTGIVTCPQPLAIKGQTASCLGILVFANKADIGGQAFQYPTAQVEIFTPKWYNGYASISVVEPDGTSNQLYWGLPFKPFAYNLSSYL
jgi:hypothetical protein